MMLFPHRKRAGNPMFEPVFTGWNRLAYLLGIAGWVVALAWFWTWWLDPDHIATLPSYVMVTVTLAWITLIPAWFILLFLNARTVSPHVKPPPGRYAMVVTKAPSEPFAVVRKTLCAMLEQRGMEFDVWLADEDPDEATRRWCEEHGVLVSTRKGIAAYHQPKWPRRTRCKEGNLAWFYDRYGYARYDFVAQFDADHVPAPTYLLEVMRPFADPDVGYVSAPSICDANAATSWAARGRLHAEASLHGALQAGYNNGWAPLCIGSHYAVRTAALRQIGGLGPELAEDHSTTLMMQSGGWKGVHALDAIAHGDGPESFADLAVQEFQWSRSLVTILLQYSRLHVPHLSPRLKFQFLFSQFWYPLFSMFMALMFVLPVIALVSGHIFVNVGYPAFIAHFAPLSLLLIVFAYFWRGTGTFRPHDAPIFSWEGMAFIFLRWPWSLAGCAFAVRDALSGSFVDFRITPKGAKEKQPLPVRVLAPYVALAAISAAAMWLAPQDTPARGFHIFAGLNALIYGLLALTLVAKHARENALPLVPRTAANGIATLCAALVVAGGTLGLRDHGTGALEALSHGQPYVSFTETAFAVAGAGLGGGKTKVVRFRLKWHGLSPSIQAQANPEPPAAPAEIPVPVPAKEPAPVMLAGLEREKM